MIIGQEQVKQEIKKLLEIFTNSKGYIRPHFFLTGKSGSGKTHTIKTLCDELDINFLEINGAQLTKEGTSGNSLSKALSPLLCKKDMANVVFVDEFDKLFISNNSNTSSAHETTLGVQNEFLKILESPVTSVYGDYGKYQDVDISKTLFIFAGAFNNEEDITLDKLRNFGVKTEFLGRVGLIYNTNPLTLNDLYKILDNSVLLKMYLRLFPDVKKEKVTEKVKKFLKENFENNTLGARLINTLIHQYFIKGGKLGLSEVKEVSFQTAMELS